MNPTIELERGIVATYNSSQGVDDNVRELIMRAYINWVRSVVQWITDSKNVGRLEKIPTFPDTRLIEFWMKEALWNHWFLSREIWISIEKVCLQLADLTRAPFQNYFTIAQKDGILAIQRTYPQSGWLRWVASHSDAILINDVFIPHWWDITHILETFPDETHRIWRRSSWLKPISWVRWPQPVDDLYFVLQSVFSVMQGKTLKFNPDSFTNTIKATKFILDVYCLLPREYRKSFHPIQIWHDWTINYPISKPIWWSPKK